MQESAHNRYFKTSYSREDNAWLVATTADLNRALARFRLLRDPGVLPLIRGRPQLLASLPAILISRRLEVGQPPCLPLPLYSPGLSSSLTSYVHVPRERLPRIGPRRRDCITQWLDSRHSLRLSVLPLSFLLEKTMPKRFTGFSFREFITAT
jgi:hypothetical protein